MYKKILIPLDGSKTAEAVLPLARSWSSKLKLPVELIAVIDTAELARSLSTIERFYMNSLVDEERADAANIWREPPRIFSRRAASLGWKREVPRISSLRRRRPIKAC